MASTSQDASPPPVTADLFSTKSLLILCSSVVYCGLNYSLNFYTEYIFGTAPHQLGFQVALFFGFINFFLSFTSSMLMLCHVIEPLSLYSVKSLLQQP